MNTRPRFLSPPPTRISYKGVALLFYGRRPPPNYMGWVAPTIRQGRFDWVRGGNKILWPTLPYYSPWRHSSAAYYWKVTGCHSPTMEQGRGNQQEYSLFVRMPACLKGVNDWPVPSWLQANIIGWCPALMAYRIVG